LGFGVVKTSTIKPKEAHGLFHEFNF